jgi:glycosyltransferase involved in cell wall biosynthesis
MLCRVSWREAGLDWTEGPPNLDYGFAPHRLTPGLACRVAIPPSRRRADRLLVQFGTYGRRNAGRLTCRLLGRFGGVLARSEIDIAALADCAFADVLGLARRRPGRRCTMELSLDAAPGNEIAVFVARDPRAVGVQECSLESPADALDLRKLLDEPTRQGDLRHARARLRPGDRVLVCTHGLPPGGAERQWIYLAIGFKRAGLDVRFVLDDAPEGARAHYLPLLRAAGIEPRPLSRLSPAALRRIVTADRTLAAVLRSRIFPQPDRLARFTLMFRQWRPRAVFAQLDDTNLYAGVAALLADVPRIVVSFRNYNPTHFPAIHQPWFRDAYAALARSARVAFTGNAESANRDYEAWIGLAAGRTVFIPNAADADRFRPPRAADVAACRSALGIGEAGELLLGVFRLSPEKNPAAFLAVCARLLAARPRLRVAIAGVGPMEHDVAAQAAALGFGDRIGLLGRRDDIEMLMAAADLLLLASDREGMPNVVVEAQLMGLPVVATDAGGTRHAMLPGVSGVLCPVGDIAALAASCAGILADRSLAGRMGEAGARHARAAFGIDAMAKRYAACAGLDGARPAAPPGLRLPRGRLAGLAAAASRAARVPRVQSPAGRGER